MNSSYGQFCPIARALEVVGSRWTLLIVRDLLSYDLRGFNELSRGLPRMSRGLLSERLRQLQAAGVIERRRTDKGSEYRLTQAGAELGPILEGLLKWGARWTFQAPREDELDPLLLMWWMRRRVRREALPGRRIFVQFDFRNHGHCYWLVLERSDVSVCLSKPNADIDVWVDADLEVFYRVWLGQLEFASAQEEAAISLVATPELERRFPKWFRWSPATDYLGTQAESDWSSADASPRG